MWASLDLLNWSLEELENLSREPFLETSRPSIDLGSAKSADAKKKSGSWFRFYFRKNRFDPKLDRNRKKPVWQLCSNWVRFQRETRDEPSKWKCNGWALPLRVLGFCQPRSLFTPLNQVSVPPRGAKTWGDQSGIQLKTRIFLNFLSSALDTHGS